MVSTPVQSSISVSKPTHDVTWRQQFPGEGSECYYINGEILSATGFEDTSLSISLTDEKDSTNSVVTPSVQVSNQRRPSNQLLFSPEKTDTEDMDFHSQWSSKLTKISHYQTV